MDHNLSTSTKTHSTHGIEDLLKAAFKRTKERFLTYFLTYILSIFIFIGVFIAIGLLVAINIVVGTGAQSQGITILLGLISGIFAIGLLIYAGCWSSLAYIFALISPQKMGVMDVYKSVKPLVWSYFKVSVITTLFMMGLLPFGILSLGIVLVLWGIWGMFLIFVFLDKKEKGLNNLFISKAIVSSMFWGIVFRALMIYGAYLVIVFSIGAVQGNEGSGIGSFLIGIIGIFAGPFITSYFYEMYKSVPAPKEVSKNTTWIVLSFIGWILSVGLSIVFFTAIAQGVQESIKSGEFQKMMKMMQQDSEKMDPDEFSERDLQKLEMEMEKLIESSTSNGS